MDAEKGRDITRDERDIHESHHVNEGIKIAKRAMNINLVNKQFTEYEILAQALVFFLAGYETTTTTLTFCTYELALNPHIQRHSQKKSILPSIPTEGSLARLPYLDAVLSETLRLHPPSLRLTRLAATDYKLDKTGITIQKGQQIEIPVYAIHTCKENYPNPFQFNPDRFMPENRHNMKPYTYLPFGAGPRSCIGMRFALLEAKLALAHIIRRFNFIKTQNTDVPLQYKRTYRITTPKIFIIEIDSILIMINNNKWKKTLNYWTERNIPGPKPIPIFGNYLSFFFKDLPHLELEWYHKYGRLYGTFAGEKRELMVSDPEMIKQLLVRDFYSMPNRRDIGTRHKVFMSVMFLSRDENWKRIRAIASSSFTSSKIKQTIGLINEC
ncbi:unnamed protein product, partial [Oppiella nova]